MTRSEMVARARGRGTRSGADEQRAAGLEVPASADRCAAATVGEPCRCFATAAADEHARIRTHPSGEQRA